MRNLSDDSAGRAFDVNQTAQINAARNLTRVNGKGLSKRVVRAESLQRQKNQNVDADQRVIDERRNLAVGIVVADGKHFFENLTYSKKL